MNKIILSLLISTITLHAIPSLETAAQYQKDEQFADAIACYEDIVRANMLTSMHTFN